MRRERVNMGAKKKRRRRRRKRGEEVKGGKGREE